MRKLAVLASGSGTILASILDHNIPVELVLADKPCKALEIATDAHVSTALVSRRGFGYRPGIGNQWDRNGFTAQIAAVLIQHKIEVVAMAGFMTVLHPVIFQSYGGRILNIHPALLPAFKGEFAVRDALAAGVKETGSTVHIATEKLDDETYILGQVKVPVVPGDSVDSLWERIKIEEGERFELSRAYTQLAFQASAIGH